MLYALNICYAQCKCNFLIVSMTIISYVFMDPNVLYHNVVKIFLKRNIHILMLVLQDRRYLKTGRLKRSQISILFLSIKNLRRLFYLFTYILIDYLVHEITEEFWKNSHFENMRTGFLQRCQKSLRCKISLICL